MYIKNTDSVSLLTNNGVTCVNINNVKGPVLKTVRKKNIFLEVTNRPVPHNSKKH